MDSENGDVTNETGEVGPRGGTTTVTKSGLVKKNLWVPRDLAELLRKRAFDDRRSEAEIMREGLERVLSLASPGDPDQEAN